MVVQIRLFIVFLFLLVYSKGLHAQEEAILNGTVIDSLTGEVITYANVTAGLVSSDPYRIESFAISDAEGRFQLKKLQVDSTYLLQSSYLGYQTTIDTLKVAVQQHDIILKMQSAANDLSVVEVTYKLPIRVSGDTISYAADAFTDGNERKLEDVLKKLPGFAVDDKGEISVNGKRVENLKVDGRDFFGGNSKLAARSLPANAVDRIDVLDNYADDEQLGQFADGRGTALNIRLLEDKKNIVFGELYAGYGPSTETDLGTDAFYFGPKTSVNIITNFNDIGRQVLTYQDMFRFNGGFAADQGGGAISFTPTQLGLGSDPELNAALNTDLAAVSVQYKPNQQFNASSTLIYGDDRRQNISETLRIILGGETNSRVEQAEKSTDDDHALTGLLRLDFEASKALSFSYRAIVGTGTQNRNAFTWISTTDDQLYSSLDQQNEQRSSNLRQQLRINYSKKERELWVLRLD
ncbi:MAG: carboxypeptidase regulatory-like domain-containing protein, partial [Bacteroidota bacterium]